MKELYGVYGASGCGRTIMPFLREAQGQELYEYVFIDDAPQTAFVNGHAVLPWRDFLNVAKKKQVSIAIANSGVRETLAHKIIDAGVEWRGATSTKSAVLDAVKIGPGAIISPFATIGSNVVVGRGLLADIHSCVNHDCVLGDFVTLAPYANCNGNVVLEDHVYVGSGAVIKQGQAGKPLVIGRGAVIGMGAVVTRDVPAGMTVVGNPARPLVKG